MVKRFSTKTIMKKHIVNEDPREGKIIIVIQDILFHFFHGFVQDVPAQIWWTPTSAYKIAPEPSCNSGGWLEHRVTGFYLWSNIRECLKIVDPHNTLHTIHCRKPMHFETQILGRKFFDQVVTRVQVSLISKDASYNCIFLKRHRLPTIQKKKNTTVFQLETKNTLEISILYSFQYGVFIFLSGALNCCLFSCWVSDPREKAPWSLPSKFLGGKLLLIRLPQLDDFGCTLLGPQLGFHRENGGENPWDGGPLIINRPHIRLI